jgi:hypothetical protein
MHWGPYLTARADLVTTLADQIRDTVSADEPTPPWCPSGQARPSPDLLGDLAVWRAANTVPDSDHRPTGPKQLAKAHTLWQRSLEHRLGAAHTPAQATWTLLLHTLAPDTRRDDFTPQLAARLAAVARAGIDAHTLLRTTLAAPLPDDHAASALWWRISRHLAPAVAAQADNGNQHRLSPVWVDHLTDTVGEDRSAAMQTSAWWPALVTVVDHALARGQTLDALLSIAGTHDPEVDLDDAQAMVWRVSLLTDPTPADDTPPPPPEDHDDDLEWLPPTTPGIDGTSAANLSPADPDTATKSLDDVYTALNAAALGRAGMGVLEPTPAEIEAMVAHAAEWDDAPFTPQRAAHINDMARNFYAERLDTAWGGDYLRDRLRTDQTPPGAGYAPVGWTHLVTHLRTRASAMRRCSPSDWSPAPAPDDSSTGSATASSSPSPPTTPSSGSSPDGTPTPATSTGRSTSTPPPQPCSTKARCSTGSTNSCSNVAPFPSS